VIAFLQVSHARFQDKLVRGQRAGTLREGHVVPTAFPRNLPAHHKQPLAQLRRRGLFPAFPFGTDLTVDEQRLMQLASPRSRLGHVYRLAAGRAVAQFSMQLPAA
jgi:hypothetical protein